MERFGYDRSKTAKSGVEHSARSITFSRECGS
jgi:hypothetical protein